MQNHQQALLVVLSYIIGFITAFIMFGLGDDVKDPGDHGKRIPRDTSLSYPSVLPNLHVNEEGLILGYGEEARVISAVTDESVAEPGFHVAIVNASLSPDNKYVHYCAQMDTASETCHHFIYSIKDHKNYLVKNEDGTPFVTDNEEADSLRWTGFAEVSIDDRFTNAESNWWLK